MPQVTRLIAGLSVMASVCVAAQAEALQRPKADLNVVEIRSTDLGEDTFRAIKGYDEVWPFLVLERIRQGATEGAQAKLLRSWHLRDMVGGQRFDRANEGDEIDDIEWRGDVLEFVYTSRKSREKCRVSRLTEEKPTVSCRPIKP
jgi:hypothetical protein